MLQASEPISTAKMAGLQISRKLFKTQNTAFYQQKPVFTIRPIFFSLSYPQGVGRT